MDTELKKILGKVANTIRELTMEAVQKANSGHPGLPMGCAELGAYLWGSILRYNPKNPKWLNRDRFVLSAGHGSMLLYSCLYLSGYSLTLDEIKRFRQLHSQTPGHPEYGHTVGVEATTGPLGQGVGNAVGMALGLKILGSLFNTDQFPLFTAKVYCLAGDGCIMEGVSAEASSFAGHLGLDNLILIYDANKITLDGPLAESCSEDTKMRYRAYGWDIYEMDGNDLDQIEETFNKIKSVPQKKPILLMSHTIIGKGSPHKAGTSKAHGAPLGVDEVIATKKALGLPDEDFFVPQAVKTYFEQKIPGDIAREEEWKEMFRNWSKAHPDLHQKFLHMLEKKLPPDLEEQLSKIEIKSPIAGRGASNIVINVLADLLPQLYGGSADLSESDYTMIKKYPLIAPGQFTGRNIKFGTREFAMATICSGLSLTDMITPLCGTFLAFSDYMRPGIRLAALSHYQVVYQFTHDSILLGEDGPTHQAIEQVAALRAMPNLHLIRPGSSWEVKMAWIAALKYKGPTALVLSRQTMNEVLATHIPYADGMAHGAYIVKRENGKPDFTLIATGSELPLAWDVTVALEKLGKNVRLVSMPSWKHFEAETESYRESVLGGDIGTRVCIEAACSFGWAKWIGMKGISICVDTFGQSAPLIDVAAEFGMTVDSILDRLL